MGALARFDVPFLAAVVAVYFSQGFRSSFTGLAVQYVLKDGFRLDPSAMAGVVATTILPWSLKPLYGIVSDCVPIGGRRRRPWLQIFFGINLVAHFLLWLGVGSSGSEWNRLGPFVACLVLASLGGAAADVVIDALIAEKSRGCSETENGAIQSFAWSSMAAGGLLGSALSGAAMRTAGPRAMFLATCVSPLAGLLAVSRVREGIGPRGTSLEEVGEGETPPPSSVAEHLTVLLRAASSPAIWRPLVYFFAVGACSPSLDPSLFYFFTGELGLSADFLGGAKAVAWGGAMLGSIIYNNGLRDSPVRPVLAAVQACQALAVAANVLLVTRRSATLGIPDGVFVMLSSLAGEALSVLRMMPFSVIAARLCPPGVEGTMFSLFMSANNAGMAAGSYGGGLLARTLGIQEGAGSSYDGGGALEHAPLATGLAVQASAMLLPLALIPLLLPRGLSSADTGLKAE